MVRTVLLSSFLLIGFLGFAQPDSGTRSIAIPPVSSGSPTQAQLPAASSPSIFDAPTASSSRTIEGTELNADFGKPQKWANPNEQYIERLNKRSGTGDSQEAIRKNQFMGDVRTGAALVRIVYRDHEYPDGDMIRILVNDKVAIPRIYLDSDYKGFDLQLEDGFNKIDFEALNQGSSGPNTAEFIVYDDKGAVISSNRWNLATGFKATVIVIKE